MCGADTLEVGHLESQRSLPTLRPDQTGLTPMARKLRLQLGHSVAVLNAPDGFATQLEPGPREVSSSLRTNETYDAVLLFVHNVDDLRRLGPSAIRAAKPNGLLWITYPKGGTARGNTDLPATPWWVRRDGARRDHVGDRLQAGRVRRRRGRLDRASLQASLK